MNKSFIAYIDESGGHGFNFSAEGNSKFFVVCAILIEKENEKSLHEQFEKIKTKYFPSSELKSSKIGGKENVREKILSEIEKLDFGIYCLVVDKKKILPNTGLQYKESFYKFLYGLLYKSLYKTFSSLEIIADEMISSDFVKSFETYIKENHTVDLFNQNNITFGKSSKRILLQLSDFIGGSLNRFYSGKTLNNPLDFLPGKLLSKKIWPEEHIPYTAELDESTDEFEETISKLSIMRIEDYIERNIRNSDNNIRTRVMFLYKLMSTFLYISKSRYVHTREIIDYIENASQGKITEQFLRQNVVGPLRSEGLLIASDVSGYKIISTKNDLITFFNLFSRIINPMLKRLKMSHESILHATNKQLDILEYPEFNYLKKVIEQN